MGFFTDIPIRSNGGIIEASWFNTLRTKLIGFFGEGAIEQTEQIINNNEGTPTNITALVFDGASYSGVDIDYEIYREDANPEYRLEKGTLSLYYKNSTWFLDYGSTAGEDSGVSLTIATVAGVGTVKYTSDNMAGGSYTGTINFKARTFQQ